MDDLGAIFSRFFSNLLGGIPNIIYAVLLLVVAFVAAAVVKSLLTKLLKAIKVENLLGKIGVNEKAAQSTVG